MRIVLHIGQQKSGTSAIQMAFSQASHEFQKIGILYPNPERSSAIGYNHEPLGAALNWGQRMPRGLARRFTPETLRAGFEAYARDVKNEVARVRPAVLFLSAESLFTPLDAEGAARLGGWLRSLADDIAVVAYVRRPSGIYLSKIQLQLRATGDISRPGPVFYRGVLESWSAAFGGRLTVLPYERELLPSGDIVADFVGRFMPELPFHHIDYPRVAINSGSSNEILSLMQAFNLATVRHRAPADKTARNFEKMLVRTAEALGRQVARPRLYDEVADWVDHASTDLLWLRDHFGVAFRDLDYTKIGTVKATPVAKLPPVEAVCPVDRTARDLILMQAIEPLVDKMDEDDPRRLSIGSDAVLWVHPRRRRAEAAAVREEALRTQQQPHDVIAGPVPASHGADAQEAAQEGDADG